MRFWIDHPALFYGLHLLVGVWLALYGGLAPAAVALTLWMPFLTRAQWRMPLRGSCVAVVMVGWISIGYQLPDCPQDGLEGEGVVAIHSLSKRQGPFGASWLARGVLRTYEVDGQVLGRRVPVCLYLSARARPPEPGGTYRISGRLKQSDRYRYILKPKRRHKWRILGRQKWLPAWRYRWKSSLSASLHGRLSNKRAAALLAGLATGEFTDPRALMGFRRLGLAHLMAISGFHFSVIAALLSLLLRPFFSPRLAASVLALVISTYFLFLGPFPSVQRAWVMVLISCGGRVCGRSVTALNSLGVALTVCLLWNPCTIVQLGFQYSFACTAAIVLLYRPIEQLLRGVLPARSLQKARQLGLIHQLGYLGTTVLRKGVAVSIAAHLVALPLTLCYFHRFPLVGLIYNLIFPVMIGLFMVGLVCSWGLPWVGAWLLERLAMGAEVVIQSINELPSFFDLQLRYALPAPVATWTVILVLGCALCKRGVFQVHGRAHSPVLLRGV